jgi:hypothetical protein
MNEKQYQGSYELETPKKSNEQAQYYKNGTCDRVTPFNGTLGSDWASPENLDIKY